MRQMVAHAPRQIVATVLRQIVAVRVFAHNKTACSGLHHCLLVFKQRMKLSQRDGFLLGAGDGARTRDSLLGRQELYQTELLPLGMLVVGVRGLEPRTSWSQTMRATNCATPRKRIPARMYPHYSTLLAIRQVLSALSAAIAKSEQEKVP